MEVVEPKVAESCYVASTATIVGAVTVGEHSSVWPSAVLRAEFSTITIGAYTSVQDNVTMHCDPAHPVIVGDYCTIGHNAVVHGCTIEDCCLIGMNSTILNGAIIGKGSIIGSGAVVKEGMVVPPFSLVVGIPGKVVRTGKEEQMASNRQNAENYDNLRENHLRGVFKTYKPKPKL